MSLSCTHCKQSLALKSFLSILLVFKLGRPLNPDDVVFLFVDLLCASVEQEVVVSPQERIVKDGIKVGPFETAGLIDSVVGQESIVDAGGASVDAHIHVQLRLHKLNAVPESIAESERVRLENQFVAQNVDPKGEQFKLKFDFEVGCPEIEDLLATNEGRQLLSEGEVLNRL